MALKNNMNDEEGEAKKSLLIKIAVSIIIAIVFFLWLANLKGVFESDQNKKVDTSWQKISEDINQRMKEIEKRMEDSQASSTKKNFVDELIKKTDSIASSSSNVSTSTVVEEIKKELIDLTKSTSTSPKRIGCPEYINCMPSIGEARSCAVPVGCENITQIAY